VSWFYNSSDFYWIFRANISHQIELFVKYVTISMTICIEVIIFSQFWLLHEILHNLGVQLLYFIFFLDCHQLWILIFLKFWMSIFLSISCLFYIIMYSWLKFTLITKLSFLFPFFLTWRYDFFLKDITVVTHG
jgi:hypothetical protein